MAEHTLEQSIFLHAIELDSPEDRAAYLEEACRDNPGLRTDLDALLTAHDRLGCVASPPIQLDATRALTPPTEVAGTLIGPYKLIEQIGEGGMGTVWMAQQTEPVKRLVAVKLIKAGMDSRQVIARFEAERQALAVMDHANIARILEAGTKGEPGGVSPGRPYFVMDLVKGVPITRYCDERHLTPRERLELFMPVCQAIQHAHQKGIIHRDLKPSNVLVALHDGKPVPKVIDFGVAKATGQTLTERTLVTGFGTIVGTLEYMSPEQAEMNQLDIDTRSDIYSLGVLLYELLTGSPPFARRDLERAGLLETLRVIREQEPPKPSTKLGTAEGLAALAANRGMEPTRLTNLVRGELDWIVMRCLEKDRNRRYETASSLAADVQRYLQDEPVQACPPSARYRFGKFARRHKAALVLSAVIATALLAGVGMLAASNVLITRARDQKELALSQARASESVAKTQEQLARARYREVQESLARQTWERARQAFEKDQIGPGLLWTIASWRAATEADHRALQHAARANLSAWLPYLPHLQAVLSHTHPVENAIFSADGKIVVTASEDNTARLWDAATGRQFGAPLPHPSAVLGVALSPDARTLFTGSPDGIARLWETATGRQCGTLLVHQSGIMCLALSPDGTALLTACSDGMGHLWDVATRQRRIPPFPLKPIEATAWNVEFSRDGRFIVSPGRDGTMLWDAATGRPAGPTFTNPSSSRCAALSPDGKTLVTGSPDGTVRLWSAATGQPLSPPLNGAARQWSSATGDPLGPPVTGHVDRIRDVAFSPDGELFLTASADGTARLWDAVVGQPIGFPLHHTGPVRTARFSPDGATIRTTCADGGVRLWERNVHQPLRCVVEDAGMPVAITADNKSFVALKDGVLRFRATADGRPTGPTIIHPGGVQFAALGRDGKTIVTAGADQTVRLWDKATGAAVRSPIPHPKQIFGPDSRSEGRSATTIPRPRGIVGLAVRPDGSSMLYCVADDTLRFWDVETGARLAAVPVECKGMEGVALTADCSRFLIFSGVGEARLWDLPARSASGRPFPYPGIIHAAAFSPSGESFVLGGEDQTARLWDTITGSPLLPPFSHGAWITAVAFSSDGTMIATGGEDKAVRLWDAATGEPIGPRLMHSGRLTSVLFSPDNKTIIAGERNGSVLLFTMDPELPDDAERIATWVEVLTGARIDLTQSHVQLLDNAAWLAARERLEKDGGPPMPAHCNRRL